MKNAKPHVLIIEDDIPLCQALVMRLNKEFEVEYSLNINDVLKNISENYYDMYLVDLTLPGLYEKNGLEICKLIRQKHKQVPIIVITGTKAINYKINAFKIGVNDYICKPFSTLELAARMRNWINNPSKHSAENIIEFRDIKINLEKHVVTRSHTEIHLRRKEFELLGLLIKNHNTILTRDVINVKLSLSMERCSNTVDVHIRNLRKKLDDPFKHKIIRTIHGVGYGIY